MPQPQPTNEATAMKTCFYNGENALFVAVGEAVFQISRDRLTSSALDLPKLPPKPGTKVEGMCAAQPVALAGVTAAEFADLMWAVHAWPRDIIAFSNGDDCIAKAIKLLNIASLARRYAFDELDDWALGDALRILKSDADFVTQSIAFKILHVTRAWGAHSKYFLDAELLAGVRLGSDIHVDLIDAIQTLQALDSRRLLGRMYYRLLLAGESAWNVDRLTKTDCRRLLNGHLVITRRIRVLELSLFHPHIKSNCHHCSWTAWRNAQPRTNSTGPADILAFLMELQNSLRGAVVNNAIGRRGGRARVSKRWTCSRCGTSCILGGDNPYSTALQTIEDNLLTLFDSDHPLVMKM